MALLDWTKKVKEAEWKKFEDIKKTFNSVDYIGNQHYVFNIIGNEYIMVSVVKFRPQFVIIKFLGTNAECNKLTDISNLKKDLKLRMKFNIREF